METQETYTVAVPISRPPGDLSKDRTAYRNRGHTGATGQCGQRLQHCEIWRVHWNGGLDPRSRRALHRGGRLLLPYWCRVGRPGHLGVWLPAGSLHRGDPGPHRHGFGGTHQHPRPGRPARHRHRRPVPQQLRLLCDDRPWQRPVYPLRPQFQLLVRRWARRWRLATSYLCPAAPAGPPVPTSTSRYASTARGQIQDITCQLHNERGENELNPEYGFALLPPMKRRRGCRTANGSPGQMVHGGQG